MKTQAEIQQELNVDFLHAFSGPHGERALKHLSGFCLEKGSTFVEDSVHKSTFNEGARSVILEIRHWLELDISKLERD